MDKMCHHTANLGQAIRSILNFWRLVETKFNKKAPIKQKMFILFWSLNKNILLCLATIHHHFGYLNIKMYIWITDLGNIWDIVDIYVNNVQYLDNNVFRFKMAAV